MNSNNFKQVLFSPTVLSSVACLVLLIFGQIIAPGFASKDFIINLLVGASFYGLVAGGQNLVIISGGGGLDMSVGKFVTLGAIISGVVLNADDQNIVYALAAVIIVTFLLGAINGIGITILSIPPLVMTLAMSIVVVAIIKFTTQGGAVKGASPLLQSIITGKIWGIPGILFIWVLYIIAMEIILKRTAFGVKLFAIGTNEYAAKVSGVNTTKFRILVYGICSAISGVTGFLYLGYLSSVYNISLGDPYTLSSIIAVVIGGTLLSGGKGNYIGVAIGAVLMQLLDSVLTTMSIDPSSRSMLYGMVLLFIIFFYGREKRIQA